MGYEPSRKYFLWCIMNAVMRAPVKTGALSNAAQGRLSKLNAGPFL